MAQFRGQGVSGGKAYGRLMFYKSASNAEQKRAIENVRDELLRLNMAKEISLQQLQQTYEKAKRLMSPESAEIFRTHVILLESPDFYDGISHMIADEKVCAEYAVFSIAERLKKRLEKGGMTSAVNDIDDVSECLLRNLKNESFNRISPKDKVIICAESLVPSQVLDFYESNITGFCLMGNSHSGHIKILANAMHIPAVVGISDLTDTYAGKEAEIDGETGVLKVDEKS